MNLANPFTSRVRGFRVIDLAALAVLATVALGSYALKTLAGAQGADTADVEAQITQQQARIRLLKAEISHLEDPERMERLSSQYLNLHPVDPTHEAQAEDLAKIASLPFMGRADGEAGRAGRPEDTQATSAIRTAPPDPPSHLPHTPTEQE